MASVASAITRKSPASTGALKAMPPSSESDSLPRARTAITPMIRNRGTVISPWLTIWNSAPWAPFSSRAKMQHDEPELRDRGVREHHAHVVLREREDRPVEDREDRDDDEQLLPVLGSVGHHRQDDAQEAVDADLRKHA